MLVATLGPIGMRIFTDLDNGSNAGPEREAERERIAVNLSGVHAIIAVASAKGGAGKSVVAVNLAAAMALKSKKVAILDADLNAPSVVSMLGMKPRRSALFSEGIEPAAGPHGLRVVASDMLPGGEPPPVVFLDDEAAMAAVNNNHQRPVPLSRTQGLRTMLAQSQLGTLDVLIIDLPPGVARLYELAESARIDGVILISQPSEHAERAARNSIKLAIADGLPIVGIIENLAGYNCDGCRSMRPLLPAGGIAGLASEVGLPVLARLAFDPHLAETADRGVLYVREYPDSPTTKAIGDMMTVLERWLATRSVESRPTS